MATCKSTHYLLYAVDGTGSKDWRPAPSGYSHTFQFYKNFNPVSVEKPPNFPDGPGTFGTDVDNLIADGMKWIKARVKAQKAKGASFRPQVLSTSSLVQPEYDVEIVLVGHSRGATIVGDMARKIGSELDIGVLFLGLFDAVDRSWNSDGGTVENVEMTAHAVRNPNMPSERGASRPTFGNTYLSSLSHYRQRYFNTSHGGVGGSPVTEYAKVAVTGDYSCAGPSKSELLTTELHRQASKGDTMASLAVTGHVYDSSMVSPSQAITFSSKLTQQQMDLHAAEVRFLEERQKKIETYALRCESESAHAYRWMVSQAVAIGLPVS